MRQFQFRLQSLLDVRKRYEEQAQANLGFQEQIMAGLVAEREFLGQAIKNQRERLVFTDEESVSLDALRQDQRWLSRLERDYQEKEDQIIKSRERLEQLRLELVQRTKDREIMDKLKERDYIVWQKESRRLDQVALDEISSIAFNRRKRQSGEARTWVLLAVMMILLFTLVYLTGTVSGRQWSDQMRKNMMSFEFQKMKKAGKVIGSAGAGIDSGTSEGDLLLPDEQKGITLESVRKEKERLGRWETKLKEQEERVQLELIALADMRDKMAEMQSDIDQKKQDLEKLQKAVDTEEAQKREERLDKLAKLYTNMKKDAAKLLMELDPESAAEIIPRFKEKDLVRILQDMSKIPSINGGPSGAERAQELLDLYTEKAMQMKETGS